MAAQMITNMMLIICVITSLKHTDQSFCYHEADMSDMKTTTTMFKGVIPDFCNLLTWLQSVSHMQVHMATVQYRSMHNTIHLHGLDEQLT